MVKSIKEVCYTDPELKALRRTVKVATAQNNATAGYSCADGQNNR